MKRKAMGVSPGRLRCLAGAASAAAAVACALAGTAAPAWAASGTASAQPAAPAVAATAADAAEVAFVSIRSGDAHIYARDASGQVRALTAGKGTHTQPAWAADGKFAYTLNVGAYTQVWYTDAQGRSARRVAQTQGVESAPSWSPDSRLLAYFNKSATGSEVELVVLDTSTGLSQVLARNGHDMGPNAVSWSGDGQRLAFQGADPKETRRNQVYVVDRPTGRVLELSSKVSRGASAPQLSPDGKQVLWVADKRERAPIMLTDVDTADSRELTPEPISFNETPRWSADGKRIVFVSLRDSLASGRNEVFVMNADGSQVRNISRHDAEDFDAKWSADGRHVVFASLRSGTSLLYQADLVTGEVTPVSLHASHDMDHVLRPVARSMSAAAQRTQ